MSRVSVETFGQPDGAGYRLTRVVATAVVSNPDVHERGDELVRQAARDVIRELRDTLTAQGIPQGAINLTAKVDSKTDTTIITGEWPA